ncbi:ABC transporter ATP-binding protein [Dehalogenimonas sp. THU2]|uniref:ABC transporter ATP-binding protein n=1 Tax=Dehalogenimonas sp. THU2 TaxID=3151121 RepID=UPI0032186572
MAEAVVVSTTDLTKVFDEQVTAVDSLNINVRENAIIGFLGPNGAGKTTTIKLLLGLQKATSGSATVFGMNIADDSVNIRKRIGYLAQDPRFYEYMTARQTLRFVCKFFYEGPKDLIEKRIDETLDIVSLTRIADRAIKGFSVGERQRLGIAQAYIHAPDLLILDEPAASLDPMGRRDVLELLMQLRQKTTILYSTHILADVQRVSDEVIIINKGQLVTQSSIEKLLADKDSSYSLVTRGDGETLHGTLSGQPWVERVSRSSNNGQCTWDITVNNIEMAEGNLLRLALNSDGIFVVDFGRRKHHLEEVFMSLVEGESGG